MSIEFNGHVSLSWFLFGLCGAFVPWNIAKKMVNTDLVHRHPKVVMVD